MNILIIDQDEVAATLMVSKLKDMEHDVTWRSSKSVATKLFETEQFDCVILDPSPLLQARPVVLDVKRHVGYFPYFLLISQNLDALDPSEMGGVHDMATKPMEPQIFEEKILSAQRYTNLMAQMNDISFDTPNAGGIISKSAFGQLFLSSIDRSDRYEEQTYFLFVCVKNYEDILSMDGAYAADYTMAQLAKTLVDIRRQSDIIGQTNKNEFCVLMRGAASAREPLDATSRFAQVLSESHMINEPNIGPVELSLKLLNVPKCMKVTEHSVIFDRLG